MENPGPKARGFLFLTVKRTIRACRGQFETGHRYISVLRGQFIYPGVLPQLVTKPGVKQSPRVPGDLSDRQRETLRLIIQHYVMTANPVGSRYLARVSPLGLSDASTRNIMSDLEYLGYIDHPHTSAGRTPTDKGYRAYVDALMSRERVTEAERKAVARSLVEAYTSGDVLKESSDILARLSKQLSLVLLPSLDDGILEHVEIAELSSNRILIVLAASSGRVRTVTLETETTIGRQRIDDLRSMLNARLAGKTFREVKALFRDIVSDLSEQEKSILRVFIDAPERLFEDSGSERVKLTGAKNIFLQPEFQKRASVTDEEFQSIIELIENEEVVIHVLEQSPGGPRGSVTGVDIRIGSELNDERMTNYSVISTRFQIGDQSGMIGVIGPKRMDYARMAPLVEHVARSISNALAGK
jgi:heat-inducible transcriptional repressor